jgi:hypothetical protein
MTDRGPIDGLTLAGLNSDEALWDGFDSEDYFWHNYGRLRWDDAHIIDIVSDFFGGAASPRRQLRAIDVGTGSNLYPALTMLPFSSTVTLLERSRANRRWLRQELDRPRGSWKEKFWPVIATGRPA